MQECIVEYLFHNSAIVLLWDKLIFSPKNDFVKDEVVNETILGIILTSVTFENKRRISESHILVGIGELKILSYGYRVNLQTIRSAGYPRRRLILSRVIVVGNLCPELKLID